MVLNTMSGIYGQIMLHIQCAGKCFVILYPRRCHWAEFNLGFQPAKVQKRIFRSFSIT
jgi:hypothetical protein